MSNVVDACCCLGGDESPADATLITPLLAESKPQAAERSRPKAAVRADLNASLTSLNSNAQGSPSSPVRTGSDVEMIATPEITEKLRKPKGVVHQTQELQAASVIAVHPRSSSGDSSRGDVFTGDVVLPFPLLTDADAVVPPVQHKMGALPRERSGSRASHHNGRGAPKGDSDATVGLIDHRVRSLGHVVAAAAPAPAPVSPLMTASAVSTRSSSGSVGSHHGAGRENNVRVVSFPNVPPRSLGAFSALSPTWEVSSPASTVPSPASVIDSGALFVRAASPVRAVGLGYVDSAQEYDTDPWSPESKEELTERKKALKRDTSDTEWLANFDGDEQVFKRRECKVGWLGQLNSESTGVRSENSPETAALDVFIGKLKGVFNILEMEIDGDRWSFDLDRLETELWINPNIFAASLVGMIGFRDGDGAGEFLKQLFSIPENAAWLMYYTQKKPKLVGLTGERVMLYGAQKAFEALEVDLYKTKEYEALASKSVFALFGKFLSLDAIHAEFRRKGLTIIVDNTATDSVLKSLESRVREGEQRVREGEQRVREAEQEKIGRATAGIVASEDLSGSEMDLGKDEELVEAHTSMMSEFKALGFDPAPHVNLIGGDVDPQELFNDSLDEQFSSLVDLVNGYRFLTYLRSSRRSDAEGDISFSSLFYPDTKGHYMTLEEGLSHLLSGYPNLKGLYALDSEKSKGYEVGVCEIDPSLRGLGFSDTMMFAGGGAEGSTVSAACSVRAYSTSGRTTRSGQTSQTLQTDGMMIKSLNLHDTPIGKIRAFLSSKRPDPASVLESYISYKKFRDLLEGNMNLSLAPVTLGLTVEDEPWSAEFVDASRGSLVGLGFDGGDEEYSEIYEYFVKSLDEESKRAIQDAARSVVSRIEGLVFFYEILTEPFLKSYLSLAGVSLSLRADSIRISSGGPKKTNMSFSNIISVEIVGDKKTIDIHDPAYQAMAGHLSGLLRSIQITRK